MPIKFFRPSLVPESELSQPGAVVRADPEQGLVISTSSGGVSVSEVQPAGRQRMNTLDWINGRGVKLGQHFE